VESMGYSFNGFTLTNSLTYSNIQIKKGWNEIVWTLNSYSLTPASVITKITLSNIIPADMKWKLVDIYNYSGVRSQVIGSNLLQGLKK
jgi:hypothetical protein